MSRPKEMAFEPGSIMKPPFHFPRAFGGLFGLFFIVADPPGADAADASPPSSEVATRQTETLKFMVGVDSSYAWEMTKGRLDQPIWTHRGKPIQLYPFFHESGVGLLRIRLWTVEEGPGSLDAATQVAKAGAAAGLTPLVVLFFTDTYSDFGKSPVAARWRDTTVPQRAKAIEQYAAEVVRHFKAAGLKVPIYAIGNESDFGIAGLFADDLIKEFAPLAGTGQFPLFGEPGKPGSPKAQALLDRLRKDFWPQEAILASAAARGIREADPEARLLMHVTQSREPAFCEAFFRVMREKGVPLTYAGLSYYPAIAGDQDFTLTRQTIAHLGRSLELPTVLCESAYPSQTPAGPFAFMRRPMSRFPFTLEGQKEWLLDYLKWSWEDPNVASVIYWSPEWYRSFGLWDAMALFDAQGRSKPAAEAFEEFEAWRKQKGDRSRRWFRGSS